MLQNMTTKNVTQSLPQNSTSVRIFGSTKKEIQKLAKSQNTTISNLINIILQNYIESSIQKQKVDKIKKIQSQIQTEENWSGQKELEFLKERRNNKTL
jgi:antitoxin component of RelBE/YafQ-DinJ toxin-antitoxin module